MKEINYLKIKYEFWGYNKDQNDERTDIYLYKYDSNFSYETNVKIAKIQIRDLVESKGLHLERYIKISKIWKEIKENNLLDLADNLITREIESLDSKENEDYIKDLEELKDRIAIKEKESV